MWKREAEWNRQAYDSLRAALTATLQAPDAPTHAELFKRLCNRHELRLILMTQQEASLGLPVSPFMDRKKTDIGQCQAGFISILIKPFFDEMTQFLGEGTRQIFANVEANIKTWSDQGESALGSAASELHDGAVNGWCSADSRPASSASNIGKSTTHSGAHSQVNRFRS